MGRHRHSTPGTRGTERTPAAAGMIRTPRRPRLQAGALIGLAAAGCLLTAAAGTRSAATKDVALVVDGQTRQVRTEAATVGEVLTAAGVTVGSDGSLSPARSAPVGDGSRIVVAHLSAAAVQGNPPLVPPGPDTPDTSNTVELVVAGKSTTTALAGAKTVGDLLTAEHITLGPLDRVAPAAGTPLADGLQVRIQRGLIVVSTRSEVLPAPPDTVVTDGGLDRGVSKRIRTGHPGSVSITEHTTVRDGVPLARLDTGRTVVLAPSAGVVQVGTRTPDPAGPAAADAAAKRFTSHGIQVLTHDTTFGVNWDGLSMCESTHNPRAINANPSAGLPTYGLFQFDLPTWQDVGGTGNPIDATPKEQLMRAKMLWQRRGLEPWACRDAAH